MRSLILLVLIATSASAQSVGDFIINYKENQTGGAAVKSWAKANNTLWGTPGTSGNPQSITLGTGLSFTGSTLNAAASGGTWGTIEGDLADQEDLQDALDGKLSVTTAASTYQPLIGEGTLALSKLAVDPLNRANHAGFQDWATITGEPTTMNGYGIAGPSSPYQTGVPLWMGGVTGWTNDASASTVRTRIGLGSVEDTALSTWAGSTNLTTLGTVSAGAIPTSLLTGTISNAQLANSSITINGSAVSLGGSTTISTGLTIGTTTTSGASSGDILINTGGFLQKLTPATGVNTFLATPSSANLAAALTDETGTDKAVFSSSPTFTDSIVVNKSGRSEAAGIKVDTDEANGTVRALYLVPPANSGRIYFGKTGAAVPYSLNFSHVTVFESVPAMSVGAGIAVGRVENMYITRSAGGTELGANHVNDYGFEFMHVNTYANATIADRVATIHRSDGITFYGAKTSRTSFEGISMSWDGSRYNVKPVAGSGGGTVRTVRYWLTSTVWMGSGSGSPEGVETAGVGSMFTRTDGGANTTLYIKESGSGNTGWIAK